MRNLEMKGGRRTAYFQNNIKRNISLKTKASEEIRTATTASADHHKQLCECAICSGSRVGQMTGRANDGYSYESQDIKVVF